MKCFYSCSHFQRHFFRFRVRSFAGLLPGICGAGGWQAAPAAVHAVPNTLAQRMQACTLLNDTEVAAVVSFIRQSWGNQAGAVTALDVQRLR